MEWIIFNIFMDKFIGFNFGITEFYFGSYQEKEVFTESFARQTGFYTLFEKAFQFLYNHRMAFFG